MARTLHWIDGFSGRRYSHEWPHGLNGSPPFGSARGTRPGLTTTAPFFGQAGQGQSSDSYGLRVYGQTHWPIAQPFTWFQMGYWFRLDSPPASGERYDCYRAPFYFPVNHHPNILTYATRGWGVWNNSPYENEIYVAYGSTYPTQFQFSGVTWPGFEAGRWYWVEFRVGIANTASGVFELRIDENQIVRMTNIQTYTGTATVCNAWLSDIHDEYGWGLQQITDDEYVMTGDSENDLEWLGMSAIETLVPDGNGAQNDFTVTGETSNWRGVTQTPYSDANYVQLTGNNAAVHTKRELYTFSDVDTSRARTIHGVKVTYRGRKNNPNAVRLRPIVRLGGTIYFPPFSEDYIGPEYREYYYVWEKNPATSQPWTAAEINSAQFGFQVSTS